MAEEDTVVSCPVDPISPVATVVTGKSVDPISFEIDRLFGESVETVFSSAGGPSVAPIDV